MATPADLRRLHPRLTLSNAGLQRALATAADRAQRMADAFGLVVPVEGDEPVAAKPKKTQPQRARSGKA